MRVRGGRVLCAVHCSPLPGWLRTCVQVTMEDYPEAGMSALKYYTIQSYTK